jgi:hypothetical protein
MARWPQFKIRVARATEGVGRKEENIGNWCRLLGTSSLKEGAV